MAAFFLDLQQALRMLSRQRALVVAATLTFALGTGATTAVFRVVDQVLLREPPYPDPQHLAMVWGTFPGIPRSNLSPPTLLDLQHASRSFSGLASFVSAGFTLERPNEPLRLRAGVVGADFFSILGVRPELGRAFLPGDDRPGHRNILVLGHALWQQEFHSDPRVVGKVLRCNREPYEVVGVLPAGFDFAVPGFFSSVDFWTPSALSADEAGRGEFYLRVLGRLAPGVTFPAAQVELATLATRFRERSPALTGFGMILVPLHEQLARAARPAILVLFSAVAMVLLMACVNVSNLLLARATARGRELAMRTALGAPRFRIVRQLLLESLVLACLGGGSGLLLASALGRLLARLAPPSLLSHPDHGGVLAFAVLLSSASGLLAGVAPALRSTAPEGRSRHGSRTAESRIGLRGGLVAAQVALALPLLVGAGLLLKSLSLLVATAPGFTADRTYAMKVGLGSQAAPNALLSTAYFKRLVARARSLPGVTSAAVIDDLPLTSDVDAASFHRPDRPPMPPEQRPLAQVRTVSPGYFETLEIPLLAGRDFALLGPRETAPEAIISQRLSAHWFANEDPLGHQIALSNEPTPAHWVRIVGVVADLHDLGLDDSGHDEIYLPMEENPLSSMTLVVRTATGRELSAVTLQNAAREIDPGLPRFAVRSLASVVFHSLDERRLRAEVLASFGLTALILAAVGIYGVMSFAVRSRTREIGIRMALGAPRRRVFQLLLTQGMAFVGAGAIAGFLATLLLTRMLSSLLVGVTPLDGATFAVATALLAAAAFTACAWPTLRAVRIEPVTALGQD